MNWHHAAAATGGTCPLRHASSTYMYSQRVAGGTPPLSPQQASTTLKEWTSEPAM